MTLILHACWHVVPRSLPIVERRCSTCGAVRWFRCSGKVRLNANGRRLDGWLIYKCIVCDRSWNLPLLDRAPVAEVPSNDLAAMQTSDPAWVRTRAFDLASLRRHALHVILPADLVVTKHLADPGPADWSGVRLTVKAPWPTGLRLDRLLAVELGLSRSSLQSLFVTKKFAVAQGPRAALKMPVAGSVALRIDLDGIPTGPRASLVQASGPPPPDAEV
jgi:hypothetical protein